MSDWQTMALDYMDRCHTYERELKNARQEITGLTKERNGLLAKVHRLKGRRDLYRHRCEAYENGLFELDGMYNQNMRGSHKDLAKAYAIAQCASTIRKNAAPTYDSETAIAPRLLNADRPQPPSGEDADGEQ